MLKNPSSKANCFAANQEIPHISRNPKVHYRTHKRPPTVPILGQPNPVHIPTSHLLEIHPNIIHPSTPRSPQWSPSLRFPQQDPIHPHLLTITRHMPNPCQFYGFKLLIRQCYQHNFKQTAFNITHFPPSMLQSNKYKYYLHSLTILCNTGVMKSP